MPAPLCDLLDTVSDPCWVVDDGDQVVFRNAAAQSLGWDPGNEAVSTAATVPSADENPLHSAESPTGPGLSVIRLHQLRVMVAKPSMRPDPAMPTLDAHLMQLLKEASLDAAYLSEQFRSNEAGSHELLARSRGLRATLNDLITAGEIGGVNSPANFDRIELDDLVSIAWTHIHRSLPGATLHLQMTPSNVGVVYGRREHLRYVVQAYLMEIAVTQDNIAALSITVSQLGPHLALKFSGHGFASLPRAMRPVPPDPDAALAPCQRQTMSFRLADRLVSMHKGQVLRRNSSGDSEIIVQLPSGASALEGEQQLSAQLEIYARDLALLFSQAS